MENTINSEEKTNIKLFNIRDIAQESELKFNTELSLLNQGISILFFDNTVNESDYIIKIEDEYKYISNLGLNENTIKKLFNIYYNQKFTDVHSINRNTNEIFKLLINEYGFINNNNINITELLDNINTLIKTKNYISSNLNVPLNFINNDNKNNIDSKNEKNNMDNENSNISINNLFPEVLKINNVNTVLEYTDVSFNSGGYLLSSLINSESLFYENINQNYNIYYNTFFNNLVFIRDYNDYISNNLIIKNLFSELKFLIKCNVDEKKKIENNNEIFVNFTEALNKITNIIKNNEINYKPSINEIKEFINKLFNINEPIQNTIKFSDILDTIITKFNINSEFHSYIKRQLPIILEDLNLNKKRMSDGIYYLGISIKTINSNNNTFNSNINSKFDELLKEDKN